VLATVHEDAPVRIVGGKHAGRDLTSPKDFRVRPTAEHVRAGIMGMVGDFKDARVLDLFAGTGALGLEAMSRGAKAADFVETRPSSLHALKANIGLLRMSDRTRVFKRDALPYAEKLPANYYDIAFVDPPYESKMLDRVIARWLAVPFARILVAEHASTHVLPKGNQTQSFDETVVTIYRAVRPTTAP
jgi:16S rRNA (guanine966-N2)-methyltransferase